jgi:uncharacterized OsmC-like protein
MAVEMGGEYLGDLRVRSMHGPSASRLETEAPADNGGLGRSFSPTDLVGAALGACMLTTMGIVARRDGIPLEGATFRVEKHMSASPRRIARLPIALRMPASLGPDERRRLEAAAMACPVKRSLHPDVEVVVTFEYAG